MQKTILITGATSGLGLEAAKQLSKQGHEIILLCRNKEKGDADIRQDFPGGWENDINNAFTTLG